jgi:hypothetical protein
VDFLNGSYGLSYDAPDADTFYLCVAAGDKLSVDMPIVVHGLDPAEPTLTVRSAVAAISAVVMVLLVVLFVLTVAYHKSPHLEDKLWVSLGITVCSAMVMASVICMAFVNDVSCMMYPSLLFGGGTLLMVQLFYKAWLTLNQFAQEGERSASLSVLEWVLLGVPALAAPVLIASWWVRFYPLTTIKRFMSRDSDLYYRVCGLAEMSFNEVHVVVILLVVLIVYGFFTGLNLRMSVHQRDSKDSKRVFIALANATISLLVLAPAVVFVEESTPQLLAKFLALLLVATVTPLMTSFSHVLHAIRGDDLVALLPPTKTSSKENVLAADTPAHKSAHSQSQQDLSPGHKRVPTQSSQQNLTPDASIPQWKVERDRTLLAKELKTKTKLEDTLARLTQENDALDEQLVVVNRRVADKKDAITRCRNRVRAESTCSADLQSLHVLDAVLDSERSSGIHFTTGPNR